MELFVFSVYYCLHCWIRPATVWSVCNWQLCTLFNTGKEHFHCVWSHDFSLIYAEPGCLCNSMIFTWESEYFFFSRVFYRVNAKTGRSVHLQRQCQSWSFWRINCQSQPALIQSCLLSGGELRVLGLKCGLISTLVCQPVCSSEQCADLHLQPYVAIQSSVILHIYTETEQKKRGCLKKCLTIR